MVNHGIGFIVTLLKMNKLLQNC